MIYYKNRSYCTTEQNRCTKTKCCRHLETTDSYFTLSKNTKKLPLAMNDFSNHCELYKCELQQSH